MALLRLDLSGCLSTEEGCSKLLFNDTTGSLGAACADDENPLGYGMVGGITSAMVTKAILNVYYASSTVPFVFTFTVASNVITAATLTDINGNVTDILADLSSTAFPLVDFYVNDADYGVTFPELNDGIYNFDYTISGLDTSGDSFIYTTSGGNLVDCKVDCCIENKYKDLDVNCDCFNNKKDYIIMSEIFLSAARFSVNIGHDTKVQGFLNKATELCNQNCDC